MGKGAKSFAQYVIVVIVFVLAYKIFFKKTSDDPFRDGGVEHPKNVKHGVKHVEIDDAESKEYMDEELKEAHKKIGVKEINHDKLAKNDKEKVDVGDMNKELQPQERDMGDLMNHKEIRKGVGQMFFKDSRAHNHPKEEFFVDGVDWDLEEEFKERRAQFQKQVMSLEEPMGDGDFKDMHEAHDDDFAFVTAGSHTTYEATIEFIYSVQYFFPKSRISIFDIGLTQDERDFLKSLCKVEVDGLWLQFWPEALYKLRHRVWRPLVLQLALAKYGHFVYVEPGRFINKQNLKKYLEHSRKHGVSVAGRRLQYSSFVVTSHHMYSFLKTNELKLQKTPHFDFTVMILHNTNRVRNYFMRYLISCAMQDYCIAPPDAKADCDYHLANNKRHANCHRYDESAINLILGNWFNYDLDEFLIQDSITRHFDGRDFSKKVKVCNKLKDEV